MQSSRVAQRGTIDLEEQKQRRISCGDMYSASVAQRATIGRVSYPSLLRDGNSSGPMVARPLFDNRGNLITPMRDEPTVPRERIHSTETAQTQLRKRLAAMKAERTRK